ncbi:unnamed protein product [Phytophthora lilii]|uniref:Unnamed protein product n=1 Tax=Phytophthora lilii TaxID=2077276 RepID=A0A9W6TLZ0_9STRA|nr:unnamed protein product [Phytophthora lilii]
MNEKVASDKPFVQITSTMRGTSTTASTDKSTWYEYVAEPAAVQGQIKFDKPGLYDLTIFASDYDRTATCDACVAILDEFRPRFKTGSCPVVPSSPQSLSVATLHTFKEYQEAYDAYVRDSNVLNNLESGSDCNDILAKRKMFHEPEDDFAGTCFDDDALDANVAKLMTNPFTDDIQLDSDALEEILNLKCSWCCRKFTTLKEMFIEYDCSTTSPTSSCTIGAECSINLCVEAKGVDIATTSIVIKTSVQETSTAVIDTLPSVPLGVDTTKNVYYNIPCINFDENDVKCQYRVKLSELVDITTEFAAALPIPESELGKVSEFVFWRYNLDGGIWSTWIPSSDSPIAFTKTVTAVNIEAWTACGQLGRTVSIDVKLYTHSTLTCAKFDEMWTAVDVNQNSRGSYCSYAGSDFTVMKLDMTVADILEQVDTVSGTYTGVECEIMVKENDEAMPDTSPTVLVPHTLSTVVTKFFVVDLVNDPTTAPDTVATVTCKFTRTLRSGILTTDTIPLSIECSHTFTIADCEAPHLDEEESKQVCSSNCAGKPAPGVYEACGGAIVSSSATATMVTNTDKTCCAECSPWLQCTALDIADIKRCELPTCDSGAIISSASVAIKSSAQEASTAVLNALPNTPPESDTSTIIYATVPCAEFDAANPKCFYNAKLSDLLDVRSATFPTSASSKIFWRYNLDGGSWFAWDPIEDSDVAFKTASTKVIVEAWTACEKVGNTFSFEVKLFVHSMLTCTNFNAMWKVDANEVEGVYCTHPGSDFTVINIDMDIAKAIPHTANTVVGLRSGIECQIMVKEDGTDDKTFAVLVQQTSSAKVNKDFAITLVNNPHTARLTTAQVQCTFTRAVYGNEVALTAGATDPHSITCTHDFYLTDCDAPKLLGYPVDEACEATCAGKIKPGVNEACGGSIVKSDSLATTVSETEVACCDDCSPTLECSPIGTTSIKRCEISASPLFLTQLAVEERTVLSVQVMAVLSASTMILAFVLVIIKKIKNENGAVLIDSQYDTYYPLLE